MNTWSNIPTEEEEKIDDSLFEPLEAPKVEKPMLETKLVDIAGESDKPKTYLEDKPHRERPKRSMNEPVDIYEPGFRSDMYAAMVNFFKKKREIKDRNEALRKKLGLRG